MRNSLLKHSIICSLLACACSFVLLATPFHATASTCTSLSSTLYYGLSGTEVTALQDYLISAGYLSSSATGYFGSQTKAALKAFQTANGITATGQTGPLTRTAISQKSCATAATTVTTASAACPTGFTCAANNASSVSSSASTASASANTASASAASTMSITSPATGQSLAIGSTTVIRWNATPSNTYNIVLEQPGGIGAGFIAQSLSSNSSSTYIWNVGKVFSSNTNTTQNVATGAYRIRLESISSGPASTDEVSGWFTITASQFAVNSIMPSSAYADDSTSVVLFGSGLSSSASIYFDTNYSGIRANNRYESADGTVLVFTIPTTVSHGTHTLYINDGVSSTPVILSFVVSTIQ